MDNLVEIDVLKKKILSVKTGSTKKHYKVSISEICDVLLLLVEQIELLGKPTTVTLEAFTELDGISDFKPLKPLKPYDEIDSNRPPETT